MEGGGRGQRRARLLPARKVRWSLAGKHLLLRILFCCYCYLHPSGLLSRQGCPLIFLSNPDCVRILIYTDGIGDYISYFLPHPLLTFEELLCYLNLVPCSLLWHTIPSCASPTFDGM